MKDELTVSAAAHPVTKTFARLLKGLMRDPQSSLTAKFNGDTLHLYAKAQRGDYPVLSGAKGRCVEALEFLAEAAGAKFHLLESFSGDPAEHRPFEQNPTFDLEAAVKLVGDFCSLLFPHPLAYPLEYERKNDLAIIRLPATGVDDEILIRALDNVFYPYGFAQGMILKIRPAKEAQ